MSLLGSPTITLVRLMDRTIYRLRQTCPPHTKIASARRSRAFMSPRKDIQDKDSINVDRTEYAKSGSDNQVARTMEAFDRERTDPGEEREVVGKGTGKGANPLDVSPANPQVSGQRDPTEGGPVASPKNTPSQRSKSQPKKKEVRSGV